MQVSGPLSPVLAVRSLVKAGGDEAATARLLARGSLAGHAAPARFRKTASTLHDVVRQGELLQAPGPFDHAIATYLALRGIRSPQAAAAGHYVDLYA